MGLCFPGHTVRANASLCTTGLDVTAAEEMKTLLPTQTHPSLSPPRAGALPPSSTADKGL